VIFDVAVRMLVHDRAKCAIAIMGVAFGVTLVFVQVGLFRGLLANATRVIVESRADVWVTSKNTPNVDFPHYFSDSIVDRVRSVPGVARADNLMVSFVGLQLPNGAEETIELYGIDDPGAWNLPWSMCEGEAEAIRRGRTMLLDVSAKQRFGPFRVGDRRELMGQRFEIVGSTNAALSFTTMPMAFASFRSAQGLEPDGGAGRTAYVLVQVDRGADARSVAANLARRLPHHDVHVRDAWADRTRDYWVVSTGLGMNMALTVFLGILVGVTVVAQTLYSATIDHTRELATLKAMGATTIGLCGIVATQAVVAALAGFVLALPIVAAISVGARQLGLELVLSTASGCTIMAAAIVLCFAASLLTARRIASIDPALVFRA